VTQKNAYRNGNILVAYNLGQTVKQIATCYGLTPQSVYVVLRSKGYKPRRRENGWREKVAVTGASGEGSREGSGV
jgi:Mor family transcriptional regulator